MDSDGFGWIRMDSDADSDGCGWIRMRMDSNRIGIESKMGIKLGMQTGLEM
jgi:hypothetical protein